MRRFFERRQACTIREVGALLGISAAEVRRQIAAGDLPLERGRVPWTEAALAFHSAWPPHVTEDLVSGIAAYPELLRPSAVTWRLPAYLLIALERQAARARALTPERRLLTVEQYAAEELHALIDPETIEALRGDAAFLEACFFPETAEVFLEKVPGSTSRI